METTRHPEPADLVNLARERLGKKKSRRIMEHCKQCPDCAELLLEAVRAEAPTERVPLGRWQWFSIVLFIVALIAVVVAMVWFVRSAAPPMTPLPESGGTENGSATAGDPTTPRPGCRVAAGSPPRTAGGAPRIC